MAKKKSNKLKIIIPVICVLLIAGILCGIFIPRFQTKGIIQMNLCQGEQKGYAFNDGYKAFVKADSGTLYINEKTSAVAITDKSGKVVFNSLSEDAAKNKLASVLSLTLRDKIGNSYIINSSINSAEYRSFEISEKKKNSVTVTFSFMTHRKGEVSEIIPVKFSESNGGIKVT